MKTKISFTILLLLCKTITMSADDNIFIEYKIINISETRSHKDYTEQNFLDALKLLLIFKNNGYISNDFDGIQVFVWGKYYSNPKTIFPIYSIKLEKRAHEKSNTEFSNKDSNIFYLNDKKITETLKECERSEIISKVKEILLHEKFGIIQVENSIITMES